MRKKQLNEHSPPAPATKWVPVPDPKPGAEGPILVPLTGEPTPEDIAEAASFVESLEAHHQLARGAGPLEPGMTHRIEEDSRGRKRLVRQRVSAI